MSYKEITTGWPDNEKVKLLSKTEVKHLVNTNRWQKLGKVFNFVPVFHFEGKNFIDWRCVPKSLLELLRTKEQKSTLKRSFNDLIAMNRAEKRKHIRFLMLHAEWKDLENIYKFKPQFITMPNGKHVIDWGVLPWHIHEILKAGGSIKNTPYTLEGGIYDPNQKVKIKRPHISGYHMPSISKALRHARLPLVDRLPIRQRLYESQKGICYFCHQFFMLDASARQVGFNTDHLTPISRGGTNEESNLRGTCTDCSLNKGNMTEHEFNQSPFLKAKLSSLSIHHNGS